jgi:hypothetical protein
VKLGTSPRPREAAGTGEDTFPLGAPFFYKSNTSKVHRRVVGGIDACILKEKEEFGQGKA